MCSWWTAFVFIRAFALCLWAAVSYALPPDRPLSAFGIQTWQTENGLPQNTIHGILQTRDGFLWLATEGGLVRFDGQQFSTYDTQNSPGLNSNYINALAEDHSGALWLATAEGLTRLQQSKFHTWTTADGLPSNNVVNLKVEPNGKLLVITSAGAASFDGARFLAAQDNELQSDIDVPDRSGRITDKVKQRITAVYKDKEGTTWVGTESGLNRLVNGVVESLSTAGPISHDVILCIYEDREGDLWVGTESGGVTVLRNQPFITFSGREAAPDEPIHCVLQDSAGAIWIGTDRSGLRRYKDGRFTAMTTADGLASDVILSLAEDHDGALLAGTPDGLNRIRNGRVSVITSADGLAEDFVRSLYVDRDGSVWAGTRRGLSHIEGDRITTYTQANGLGSDFVGAIARDAHNDLWIATLHGLTRFRNGVFTNLTVEDGLSSNVVTDLYADDQGTLWIATQGGGLDRLREDSLSRFTPQLGFPDTIFGISADAFGNLWLASKTGIYRASRDQLNAYAAAGKGTLDIVSYGTSDGLRVRECSGGGHPTTVRDRNGAIWFSTARGVAVLQAGSSEAKDVRPLVALESLSIDDRTFAPEAQNEIPAGSTRLSFGYAGLSFRAPQKIRFKYKLEGFDRDWIDAGSRRVAYYTNVPPAAYTFRVMAVNGEGLWSEQAATLSIRVLPRFFQTWWFRLLAVAIVALLAYGLYYWRVRQVRARFSAVLAERNRIAREIHDTLAQGFVGVSLQLEVVSRLLNSSIDAAREHLDQARLLVRSSLEDARRSIWELRSQSSEVTDFASRLTAMARTASSSSGAKVRLEVHGTYRPLTPSVEDELFRIGQEAVANAVRHSGAANIQIDLTFDAKKLRMLVADDGCGFEGPTDSHGPDGHFGLKGMQERARNINADFSVSSKRGQGTQILVQAPAK